MVKPSRNPPGRYADGEFQDLDPGDPGRTHELPALETMPSRSMPADETGESGAAYDAEHGESDNSPPRKTPYTARTVP